jgi:hypothetical protein
MLLERRLQFEGGRPLGKSVKTHQSERIRPFFAKCALVFAYKEWGESGAIGCLDLNQTLTSVGRVGVNIIASAVTALFRGPFHSSGEVIAADLYELVTFSKKNQLLPLFAKLAVSRVALRRVEFANQTPERFRLLVGAGRG